MDVLIEAMTSFFDFCHGGNFDTLFLQMAGQE